jgi:hypothetical protein
LFHQLTTGTHSKFPLQRAATATHPFGLEFLENFSHSLNLVDVRYTPWDVFLAGMGEVMALKAAGVIDEASSNWRRKS